METTTLIAENPQAAAAGAFVLGGFFAAVGIIGLIFGILQLIAGWKILEKAGEPGWKIFIPFYNYYVLLKILGLKTWFWFTIALYVLITISFMIGKFNTTLMVTGTQEQIEAYIHSYDFAANPMIIVSLVLFIGYAILLDIIYSYRLSKVFGHGIGYTLGNIFLPGIFWLILGFGSSKYNKKRLHA